MLNFRGKISIILHPMTCYVKKTMRSPDLSCMRLSLTRIVNQYPLIVPLFAAFQINTYTGFKLSDRRRRTTDTNSLEVRASMLIGDGSLGSVKKL